MSIDLAFADLREGVLTIGSVNWYQRNYPYVWAGARVARDLK